MARLFEVRCPNRILNKNTGKEQRCNHLCVKVEPGSSGEVKCRYCGQVFNFFVDDKSTSLINVKAKTKENDERL